MTEPPSILTDLISSPYPLLYSDSVLWNFQELAQCPSDAPLLVSV